MPDVKTLPNSPRFAFYKDSSRQVFIVGPCLSLDPGSTFHVCPNQEALGANGFHCSKSEEISKRTSLFTSIGQLGSMFAGIMMTAIRTTLDGHAGMEGWRWVFIIGKSTLQNPITFYFAVDLNLCLDGLMGMPVGIFGMVCSFGLHPQVSAILICWLNSSSCQTRPSERRCLIFRKKRSNLQSTVCHLLFITAPRSILSLWLNES